MFHERRSFVRRSFTLVERNSELRILNWEFGSDGHFAQAAAKFVVVSWSTSAIERV